jgi:hypothetical protein
MALAFFTLTGSLRAVVVDYVDGGTAPDISNVTCTVDFIPRVPRGQLVWAPGLTPPQGILLAPIRARFDGDGTLHTIVGGTGVQLVANTAEIDMDQLIYDVAFSNLNFAKAPDDALISAFAFEAPKTAVTVDLAQLDRLPPKEGL